MHCLWSPYRADHYIFMLWFVLFFLRPTPLGAFGASILAPTVLDLNAPISNRNRRHWYSELAFLCNGTDRHENWAETSITVLYWTLIQEFCENLPLRGWFCSKPPLLGCFDGSPCHRPGRQRLRFSTYLSLPSIRWRANGDRLFVRLTVSAVEAQLSLSEP